MMAQTPLSEISRCKIPINKGDVPSLIWGESILTSVTEKTVSILSFSHNLHCIDKKIDWLITDIPCPKTSPATSLFSRKFMNQKIENIEYTQLMLDPTLWPHNAQLMEEMASVASTQWSPTNFIPNNNSVIAILNNVGNIELFRPTSCGYSSFLNISSIIESNYKDKIHKNMPQNMEEVKNIADALETSAFCWGSPYNDIPNLITAQKNGNIHFWQLVCNDNEISIEELTIQHSEAGEIITMQWIPISKDVFWLILGNIFGQLYVYKYQWENKCPKLIDCDCPWPHKDRMVVRHLKHKIVNDKIVLICNKHRHLLALLIDHSCTKISEYLKNLNDYKISVISESNNQFYVGTINCKIFIVHIMLGDNKLDIHIEEVIFKENFVNHDLCGLAFSKNHVICALGVINRKVLCRKEGFALDVIFLSPEDSHEREMAILLENPTEKLTDYWDCIELLRCKAMKLKILPDIDFNRLYSNNSIYETKLYHIILTCYNSLEDILKNKSKGCLPETSSEAVRERILAFHARDLMANISKKIQNEKTLVDSSSHTYAAAKKYVDYYCQKYKKDISEFVPSGAHNIKLDFEYTCQGCDENLKDFSCQKGHVNMFCSLTLTLIESDDYLSCDACGLIARKELLPQSPRCLFCDLYLNDYLKCT